ncbi:MAG: nucleotide exchange factor GrpE, partial [Gammaproteobacteria bacterium]|nr:nucleotide exchange factor GrpE [Gammaproteobacteria bacterium]
MSETTTEAQETDLNEAIDEDHSEESINEEQSEEVTEESSTEQELIDAQLKIKEYWDQIVRLNAEMENHRKRAQRDVENAHKYAVKNFSEALLPVCDSMEMGIVASEAENSNIDSIKEGMQMTLSMFIQMMEKNGIKAIDPVNEKFDPEQHQAMSMQESADHESNTVIAVMQKGYMLNDRLVRPAMV